MDMRTRVAIERDAADLVRKIEADGICEGCGKPVGATIRNSDYVTTLIADAMIATIGRITAGTATPATERNT